jgi:carboxymethylenebutenolidase
VGELMQLLTGDEHNMGAYLAEPEGKPHAGLVVLQEIFGVTDHIRRVVDGFAAEGFLTIAPSLFDRVRPGVVLDYTDVEQGRALMQELDLDAAVTDIDTAVDAVRRAGKVGAVGYCWGGAMADLAACRSGVDAAVAYYGRMIVEWLDSKPACPVMYHFGNEDPLIPPDTIEQIRGARPEGIFYRYAGAGHGFNCDERADFHPESAALALERTLTFLRENL